MLYSTLSVILVLGGLIFFHELGHFSVARLLGIGVKRFSLGFGRKLWGFTRGQTEYQIALFPLGGYVQLVGEANAEDMPEGFTKEQSFALRPPLHRMLVIAAGPIFNFVLAWLIYWGLFWSLGQMYLVPQIGTVDSNSPAAVAGIQKGDTILRIDGKDVRYWSDVAEFISGGENAELKIEVSRPVPTAASSSTLGNETANNTDTTAEPSSNTSSSVSSSASSLASAETLTFYMVPQETMRTSIFGDQEKARVIGVRASGQVMHQELGIVDAFTGSITQTWEMIKLTGLGFVKLVQRVVPMDNVGGPIMIAQMVSEQAHNGVASLLSLAALISINLGLLNLLPIPVLDGGHIFFLFIEIIIRRPVPEKVQDILVRIGMFLLISLMVFATFNDIVRSFFSE